MRMIKKISYLFSGIFFCQRLLDHNNEYFDEENYVNYRKKTNKCLNDGNNFKCIFGRKIHLRKIYHLLLHPTRVNLAIFASITIATIIISSIFISRSYYYNNNSYFYSPSQTSELPINRSFHRRAFIIGIDGVGYLPETVKVPGIYRVINNGIYTFHGATVLPSLSAESWTSLLHGVSPSKHQIFTEKKAESSFPINSKYPSIFKVLHDQNKNAIMAAFCNWFFIPKYIIEDEIGVQKYHLETEKLIVQHFEKFMQTNDPTLVFFQLDDTDVIGHHFGFFSERQADQLKKTDKTVGKIIDIIEKYDPKNESLILIQTDHGGGGTHPNMHGSDDYKDFTIFWTARGKGICKYTSINTPISICDTAKFVASYLNLKIPDIWDGKNFFSEYQC